MPYSNICAYGRYDIDTSFSVKPDLQ